MQIGDVVRLKSGGPAMTVCSVSEFIGCAWFYRSTPQYESFSPEMLQAGAAEPSLLALLSYSIAKNDWARKFLERLVATL